MFGSLESSKTTMALSRRKHKKTSCLLLALYLAVVLCVSTQLSILMHYHGRVSKGIVISRQTPMDEHSSLQEEQRLPKDEESKSSTEERITAQDKSQQHLQDGTKGGDNKNQDEDTIPHQLLFTYSQNILETKEPSHYYENIQNTIKKYREAWNEPNAPVVFLDDVECLALIKQHEPNLIKPYQQESYGAYKGDICRAVALYQTGGYYFDVDIEVLKPLVRTTPTTFITSWNVGGPSSRAFFQAVLCVTPKNPIIAATIQSIIHDWYYNEKVISKFRDSWYQKEEQQIGGPIVSVFNERVFFSKEYQKELAKLHSSWMGPSTLWIAWQALTRNAATPFSSHWLLEEYGLRGGANEFGWNRALYRQGRHHGCNFVVHDPKYRTSTPYFYSRIIGSNYCPA
jgi:mannosyltransferase OCH1-like enzyme